MSAASAAVDDYLVAREVCHRVRVGDDVGDTLRLSAGDESIGWTSAPEAGLSPLRGRHRSAIRAGSGARIGARRKVDQEHTAGRGAAIPATENVVVDVPFGSLAAVRVLPKPRQLLSSTRARASGFRSSSAGRDSAAA